MNEYEKLRQDRELKANFVPPKNIALRAWLYITISVIWVEATSAVARRVAVNRLNL